MRALPLYVAKLREKNKPEIKEGKRLMPFPSIARWAFILKEKYQMTNLGVMER